MKSSRELSAAQLDKLIASARRQCEWVHRLWQRCDHHKLPLDDPLVRETLALGESLARLIQTCEQLKRQIPVAYRPGVDPWRNHGLSAQLQPWAEIQEETRRAAQEHTRRAPRDPTAS